MAWIKLYSETTESAKLLDLATRLNITDVQAMGHLVFLWAFAERNAWESGNLEKWSKGIIARKAGWDGDADAFINALQVAGWFDENSMKIHEWACHQSELIRIRSRRKYGPSTDQVRTKYGPSTDLVRESRAEQSRAEQSREKTISVLRKFSKPTIPEIEAYCTERGNGIAAQHFYDHYEARGWLIGKNKMKDWRAAVRTWEQKNKPTAPQIDESTDEYKFLCAYAELNSVDMGKMKSYYSKSAEEARQFVSLFSDRREALEWMVGFSEKFKERGLNWNLGTLIKWRVRERQGIDIWA